MVTAPMWIVVRFALLRAGDYALGLEVLEGSGLRRHRSPGPRDLAPYPAAVVGNLSLDPAVVTRAVFERLASAGLAPVAVMAAPLDVSQAANSPRALAHA
jgi:hypothetical protein